VREGFRESVRESAQGCDGVGSGCVRAQAGARGGDGEAGRIALESGGPCLFRVVFFLVLASSLVCTPAQRQFFCVFVR